MENPEHAEAVLIERHLSTFMQWDVQGDLSCIPIECIQPFAGGNPERSLPVFARAFDVVAAQTEGVVRIVTVADGPSGRRIESGEAPPGCQPQNTHVILADVDDGNCSALGIAAIDAVVSKCLGDWIEFIQELAEADPQGPGTVFEQRRNVNPAQTVRAP